MLVFNYCIIAHLSVLYANLCFINAFNNNNDNFSKEDSNMKDTKY